MVVVGTECSEHQWVVNQWTMMMNMMQTVILIDSNIFVCNITNMQIFQFVLFNTYVVSV